MSWKKYIRITLAVFAISFIVLPSITYFFIIRGDAYKAAVSELRANQVLKDRVGNITDTRLVFWFGYSIRTVGPSGFANFEIDINGEREGGTAYLNMERSAGIWKAKEGNLFFNDGNSISFIQASK